MRVAIDPAGPLPGAAITSRRVALALAAFALACSIAGFSGWLFHLPLLRGFGFSSFPIWPWTALGFAGLSLGFIAVERDRPRLAIGCWAIPLIVASTALFENWSGTDLGVDRLWFADQIALHPYPHPGRPGVNPITIMFLLSAAGLGAHVSRLTAEARSLAATIALGLAGAAAILILFSQPGNRAAPLFSISLPGAIISVALALAVVVRNSGLGWMQDLMRDPANRNVVRILLPGALLLPLVPAILELIVAQQDFLSPTATKLLVVLCNVLVVSIIAYWAVTRVAREQAAQIELSQALDVSTVALATPDGRIVHWSVGAAQLFGWSAEDAKEKQLYALLRARCESADATLPRQPQSDWEELVMIAQDGTEIAVLEHVRRVGIPGREPVIVHMMTDISDRARVIADLRESEERLAIATATHEVGVFEWDVTSGRMDWSPGAEQRLGLVPGTITDFESWRAQIHPEDADTIVETIERAVADRAPRFSFRHRFQEPNGIVRAVEGSARAFYDTNGELERTVGAMLDVTEREEREAALRRREAQLRSIIETVPEAMLVVDEEGTIRVFSTAAEQLWGYPAYEVQGHSFAILLPFVEEGEPDSPLAHFLKTSTRAAPTETIPCAGLTKQGRRFPMEVRAGVARVDGHALFTLFARDLTEQFAAEERLSELNAELAHVGRQSAMSELAADMAHELNQPLAATSNFLAAARMLMEKGEDMERIAELLRMANEQTLRAGEIIRRLRSFTMRGEVDMRATPLESTIRDAADLVLVGTSQFNIRLTYDLDSDIPYVFADRVQVQQVVVNLLRNSVEVLRQLGGSDRRIMLSSRKSNFDMAIVEIADSGPGIPESILNQLFSRFTTTKREGSGMGIGLSISKRIIEAHGGTLSAENLPEGGAVFRFTLPTMEQSGV